MRGSFRRAVFRRRAALLEIASDERERRGPAVSRTFQLALAQRWHEAAEAFRAHKMPYQEALMLLRTDRPGMKRASMILERLGAARLLASPRSSSCESRAKQRVKEGDK